MTIDRDDDDKSGAAGSLPQAQSDRETVTPATTDYPKAIVTRSRYWRRHRGRAPAKAGGRSAAAARAGARATRRYDATRRAAAARPGPPAMSRRPSPTADRGAAKGCPRQQNRTGIGRSARLCAAHLQRVLDSGRCLRQYPRLGRFVGSTSGRRAERSGQTAEFQACSLGGGSSTIARANDRVFR